MAMPMKIFLEDACGISAVPVNVAGSGCASTNGMTASARLDEEHVADQRRDVSAVK